MHEWQEYGIEFHLAACWASAIQRDAGIGKQAEAGHRRALAQFMRDNGTGYGIRCGIYRVDHEMQETCDKIDELRLRCRRVRVDEVAVASPSVFGAPANGYGPS